MLAALYCRDTRHPLGAAAPFTLDGDSGDYNRGVRDWDITGVTHLHSSDLGLASMHLESLLIPMELLDELPERLDEARAQEMIRAALES